MQPILYLFVLGVCIGGNENFRFGVWGNTNFSVFSTNIFALGVWPNVNPQREGFCIAVEYRLNSPAM